MTPTSRTGSAVVGSQVGRRVARRGPSADGVAFAGGVDSRMARIRSAPARPSVLAWNSDPTVRIGAYSSGTSISTVSAGRRPMAPSARRTPRVTATSAVDSVVARSSTTPDRNASRSVPIVVTRYRSVASAIFGIWARPRLKARSVARPCTTSRKWADRPTRACQFARDRDAAERPTSTMKIGISGQRHEHDRGRGAIDDQRVQASTAAGTVTASTTCGR